MRFAEKIETGGRGFQQAQLAGIVHRENQIASDEKRTEAEGFARTAGPNHFTVEA